MLKESICNHLKHFSEKATTYSKPGRELELPSHLHCSIHRNQNSETEISFNSSNLRAFTPPFAQILK